MRLFPTNGAQNIWDFGTGNFSEKDLDQKTSLIKGVMQKRQTLEVPKISVVVPAYVEEKNILATLYSLAHQTFQDVEFIIVNNGEPFDNKTKELVEASGFNVIYEKRKGVARARQIGLEAARGEVIVSTDADAVHSPRWLEKIFQSYMQDKWLCAHGNCVFLSLTMAERVYRVLADIYKYNIEGGGGFCRNISGANSYFVRDAALQSGGYNTALQYGEDRDIVYKILPDGGEQFLTDDDITVFVDRGALGWWMIAESLKIRMFKLTSRQNWDDYREHVWKGSSNS